MNEDEIIQAISDVRGRNNINWMTILRLALKHAPGETRTALLAIHAADKEVSDFVRLLAYPSMRIS